MKLVDHRLGIEQEELNEDIPRSSRDSEKMSSIGTLSQGAEKGTPKDPKTEQLVRWKTQKRGRRCRALTPS